MRQTIKFQSVMLLIGAAVLVFSAIAVTLAWLFQEKQRTHNVSTSNFIFSADVYFLQPDNTHTSAAAYKDVDTGYYLVNISEPAALNYAGKLRVDIKYKGLTKAYLRVYIGDMWNVNEESILKQNTDFDVSEDWLDNRIYDNFYYYIGGETQEKGMIYSSSAEEELTIPFVGGIRNLAKINQAEIYMEIRAEAVQINRIQAFWGIPAIPE